MELEKVLANNKLEILNKKDTLGEIGYDSIIIADFDESLKSVTTSLLYTDVSPKKIAFISPEELRFSGPALKNFSEKYNHYDIKFIKRTTIILVRWALLILHNRSSCFITHSNIL